MKYSVRIGEGRILVLSDVHLPYQDQKAITLAAEVAGEFKPTHLVFNGDLWDALPVSPFPVPSKYRFRLADQIETVAREIDSLLELFGCKNKPVYYIEGNHEVWWNRYLQKKAQELEGLSILTIPSILRLPPNVTYLEHRIGYAPIEDTATPEVLAGGLHIMHGDTIRVGAQLVNVARTVSTRLGVPVLVGHWHVCQEYITTMYDGSVQAAWASGALVLPRAAYNAGRVAQQGIALVYTDGISFECKVVPFWRDGKRMKCYCLGRNFRA